MSASISFKGRTSPWSVTGAWAGKSDRSPCAKKVSCASTLCFTVGHRYRAFIVFPFHIQGGFVITKCHFAGLLGCFKACLIPIFPFRIQFCFSGLLDLDELK